MSEFTNTFIKSMTIHFEEDGMESNPIQLFKDPEYKFGIVKINIKSDIPITTKPIHIVFTIDASGSMSDMCPDGRTKMRHILFTLENMLYVLHKNTETNISVYIQSFSTTVKKIVKTNKMCDENVDSLIQKILQIIPDASTNIEAALESANRYIDLYKIENPTYDVIHLFLTDGEITSGEPNKEILKNLIKDNCTTTFIGYGLSHDSELLSFISSEQNNEYRFIDALEKAGLVYGEILHGILYKAFENVTLCGTNCEMYNYLTNQWVNNLYIGNLLSEQSKVYHIRTKIQSELCIVDLIEKEVILSSSTINEPTINEPLGIGSISDYKFRQRTQELLYDARKLSTNSNIFKLNEYFSGQFDEMIDAKPELHRKLKNFHGILTKYMIDNDRVNDAFLKNLSDDIYIANKTLGTKWGNMYTAARQTSQGRQQSYNCTHMDIDYCTPRQLSSHSNMAPLTDNNHNENVIDNYALSQDILSPYSSNSVTQVMREVSGNYDIGTL
jgi:hypothetical protein